MSWRRTGLEDLQDEVATAPAGAGKSGGAHNEA
jgi:hypothetical protein